MTIPSTLLLLATVVTQLDLSQIKTESDPGKRASKAIQYSDQKLSEARQFAADSEFTKMKESLESMAEGVELALEALKIKKNTGNYKKAEVRCREFLRRLETFEIDLPVEERPPAKAVRDRVYNVHEELLSLALGKKK